MFDEKHIEAGTLTEETLRSRTIGRIRQSLEEDGEDNCVSCDQPIPAARRAALPSAERCIGCQQAIELRQAGWFSRRRLAL